MSRRSTWIGLLLIAVGVFALGLVFFLIRRVWPEEMWHAPKAWALGVVLGALPALLLGFLGGALLRRGYVEEAELRKLRRKEALWIQIQTVGKVNLRPWMSALRLSRTEMISLLLAEVDQGGNPGYVDWGTGMFYARDAERVGSNQCPHCGGIREIVGIGSVSCPYCQAELLIPASARQTKVLPRPPSSREELFVEGA